jgi:hypothetical protein
MMVVLCQTTSIAFRRNLVTLSGTCKYDSGSSIKSGIEVRPETFKIISGIRVLKTCIRSNCDDSEKVWAYRKSLGDMYVCVPGYLDENSFGRFMSRKPDPKIFLILTSLYSQNTQNQPLAFYEVFEYLIP